MTTPTSSSKRLPVLMGMLAAGLFVLLSIYVDPPDDASRFHGNRTVLAVRVLLNDAAYNHTTQTGLSDDIFGNGRDPHNLRSQYEACSFGQLIFNKAPDRNMTKDPNDGTTAIANGVVDVKIDLSVTAGRDQISSALATKLVEVFGVPCGSGTPLADHVMVCMPGGIFDGAFSLVPLLRFVSFYSNEECSSVATQMKMIGDNLGFGPHSYEGVEYKDRSCIMGQSYSDDDAPVMCFNAAKSWQSRWYSSKSIVVDPSADGCFERNVYGIADYGNAASTVVLVKIDDASDTDFYLAFNRKAGINSGTQTAGDLVTVVIAAGEGNRLSESDLLAKLGSGEGWSHIINGKTMHVNVLDINLIANPAYARVRISENGNHCDVETKALAEL